MTRPRIALVVDYPDWAWAHHAWALREHLAERFEFSIVVEAMLGEMWKLPMGAAGTDLSMYFWRNWPRLFTTPWFRDQVRWNLGDWTEYSERYLASPAATLVCDHLYLEEPDVSDFRHALAGLSGYGTTSVKLQHIYEGLEDFPRPWGLLSDGVDLRRFRPAVRRPPRSVVIGWAGNSLWNQGPEDTKGLHTIVKPALEELQREGTPVEARFQDRAHGFRPFAAMPEYYAGLDIFVCSSVTEGTPNPVLEAMASGIPMVSTDVGIVPEVVGPLQRRFVLRERSIEAMREAIRELVEDPDLRHAIAEENAEQIRQRDWGVVAPRWGDFFEYCLG